MTFRVSSTNLAPAPIAGTAAGPILPASNGTSARRNALFCRDAGGRSRGLVELTWGLDGVHLQEQARYLMKLSDYLFERDVRFELVTSAEHALAAFDGFAVAEAVAEVRWRADSLPRFPVVTSPKARFAFPVVACCKPDTNSPASTPAMRPVAKIRVNMASPFSGRGTRANDGYRGRRCARSRCARSRL